MEILKIKRPQESSPIKVYGTILGDSGITYSFAYIVRKSSAAAFRGWICSCESFLLGMFKKNRNCKHLRHVREQYGRYGGLLPKS